MMNRKEALKQLRIMRDCNYPVSLYKFKWFRGKGYKEYCALDYAIKELELGK